MYFPSSSIPLSSLQLLYPLSSPYRLFLLLKHHLYLCSSVTLSVSSWSAQQPTRHPTLYLSLATVPSPKVSSFTSFPLSSLVSLVASAAASQTDSLVLTFFGYSSFVTRILLSLSFLLTFQNNLFPRPFPCYPFSSSQGQRSSRPARRSCAFPLRLSLLHRFHFHILYSIPTEYSSINSRVILFPRSPFLSLLLFGIPYPPSPSWPASFTGHPTHFLLFSPSLLILSMPLLLRHPDYSRRLLLPFSLFISSSNTALLPRFLLPSS